MFFSGASHRHHRLLARLPSIPRRRRGGGGRMWRRREQRRRRRLYSPSLFPQPCSHHWCDPGILSFLKNDENRIKLPFPFRFPWTSCPPEPAHQLNHSPPSPPPLLRRRRRRRSTPLRGERGGGDVDAITLWGNSQPSDPISAEPILISSKKVHSHKFSIRRFLLWDSKHTFWGNLCGGGVLQVWSIPGSLCPVNIWVLYYEFNFNATVLSIHFSVFDYLQWILILFTFHKMMNPGALVCHKAKRRHEITIQTFQSLTIQSNDVSDVRILKLETEECTR